MPTIFHEDESYYAKGEGGILKRAVYAASRVLITPDYPGHNAINASEILGRGVAQSILAAYYPSQDRTLGALAVNYGYAVGRDALPMSFASSGPTSRHTGSIGIRNLYSTVQTMNREHIRARIEEIGIIAGVRVSNPEYARYAAETLHHAGIPIVEITMTVPDATQVISHIAKSLPRMIVGGGTVLDAETARRCLDAGAKFLTSPGLVMEVVEAAIKHNVVVFPGALTPTEVIAAWKTGADFVKIFPCSQVGGPAYIRSLKVPFPDIPLIASGGVNQHSAANFILAGASVLGIGNELIPQEALQRKQEEQIQELSRRFLHIVKSTRAQIKSARNPHEDQLR